MAKKNSAVLWTVEQTLGDNDATKKTNKERARHNVGINFEPTAGENHDQPPTPSGNTLSFVDKIDEAADGTLTYTRQTVTVNNTVTDTPDIPVSGKAVSTAISNIEFMKTGTTDPSTTPTKLGIHYRNTVTGEVWIATGTSSASDWKLLSDRIHVLMNQYKTIYISGQGSSRPILCDKFNYTIDTNNRLVFTPVSPEQAYIWVNRGDFIVFDNCAENDPWGDSYWMQQVEVQSDTVLKEVTNFAFNRVNSGKIFYTWFNPITDSSTNTKYFTNYGNTTEKEIGNGELYLKFGNNTYPTGYTANTSTDVTYELPKAGNTNDNYGITRLIKYPSTAPANWNYFYDTNDAAVTPTYISHYVESNFFRKREANNPKWNSVLHQDSPSEAAFWFITNSATPDASNESPESGALYLISGGDAKTNTTGYRTQLAMGNHLYYRHTTGNGNSSWSDWITLNEYSAGIDLKLTGTEFAVNTTSTMDVYSKDRQCFTIGQNCETEHAGPSFIGGINSKLYGGSNSFIFGYGNIAGDTPTINQETNISSYNTFSSAFIVGSENKLYSSDYNFIWGTENTISSTTDVFNKNGYNIALGSSNMLGGGQHNIVIGVNNWLSQDTTNHIPSNVIMIGHDLQWKKSDGHDVAIFGRFNLKDDYRYNNGLAGTPLRITGCGLTNDNRANIEELYSSGMLWLKHAVETSCVVGDTTYANGIYIDYTNGSGGVNSTKSYSETATRSGVEFSRSFSHFTYMSPTSIGLSDVKEVKVISPEGAVAPETSRLHNVQFVSITHGSDDEYELVNGMPSRAVALEYKSAFLGSSGISLGEPKMPAWNTNIASNCETSWLTIFGNRTYAPSSLPWDDSQTKPGNLKLGKLAIKYFLDTDLQVDTTQHINNAIIPGEQVGELTFIVGTSNYGFWIHDDYYTDSTPTATYIPDPGGIGSTHLESRYIRQNTFCILMTTKPTVWNKNVNPPVITQFGEFKALVSSNF